MGRRLPLEDTISVSKDLRELLDHVPEPMRSVLKSEDQDYAFRVVRDYLLADAKGKAKSEEFFASGGIERVDAAHAQFLSSQRGN